MTTRQELAVDELRRTSSPVQWSTVLERAAASAGPPSGSGVKDQGSEGGPGRRILLAVAVLVALVGVLVWRGQQDHIVQTGPGVTVGSTVATSSSADPLVPAPTSLPSATGNPLALRSALPVTGAAGGQYIVWGGEDGSSESDRIDGFTIDLATRTATTIDAAPITASSYTSGVWTGDELVVWSVTPDGRPEAAAWRLDSRAWRRVAAPPSELLPGPSTSVAAGSSIVTVTRAGTAGAYDRTADRWALLPSVPATSFGESLVWTGSEVIYWATAYYGGPYPTEAGRPLADRGWRLRLGEREWSPLPELPEGYRTTIGSAVWDGSRVVVWGTATGGNSVEDVGVGASWRPGDASWTALPPSPQAASRGFNGTAGSQTVTVDHESGVVVLVPLDLGQGVEGRGIVLYDTRTGQWRTTDLKPIVGYASRLDVASGLVLVPDATAPIVGPLPPS